MVKKMLKSYKNTRINRPIFLIIIEEFIISWLWYRTKVNKLFHNNLLNVSSDMKEDKLIDTYAFTHVEWVKEILAERGVMLSGKKVLEIGPGGLLFRGLAFQGLGANYSALDAFQGGCLSKEAKKLYLKFINKVAKERMKFDNFNPKLMKINELNYYQNTPIELASDKLNNQKFDIIFSHGVFEHLYDVAEGMNSCKNLLADGGLMIHNVDFHAHDFWRSFPNPHMHLTLSNFQYRIAYPKFRGYPNRLRHSDFIKAINASGLNLIELRDSEHYDEEVLKIRTRLPDDFSHYSDEDLLIQRITYIANK